MPDTTVDDIHAVAGLLGYVPVGGIPFVAQLPDWSLPAVHDEGVFGISVAGGDVGTRSEIAIVITSLLLTEGAEISELAITGTGPIAVEIVVPSALAGFTTTNLFASDLGFLRSRVALLTKNTAAATAVDRLLTEIVVVATTDVYVAIPGRFILRRGKNPGAPETEAILIRPTTDQTYIRVKGRWRALDKRSL